MEDVCVELPTKNPCRKVIAQQLHIYFIRPGHCLLLRMALKWKMTQKVTPQNVQKKNLLRMS